MKIIKRKISTLISKHSQQCRYPCALCPVIAEVNKEHRSRAKQIKSELKKNQKLLFCVQNLQSTIEDLQEKLSSIENGLTFIDIANKDLKTALSCDSVVFPADKLDQLQRLIDHTESVVKEAKLISRES